MRGTVGGHANFEMLKLEGAGPMLLGGLVFRPAFE